MKTAVKDFPATAPNRKLQEWFDSIPGRITGVSMAPYTLTMLADREQEMHRIVVTYEPKPLTEEQA